MSIPFKFDLAFERNFFLKYPTFGLHFFYSRNSPISTLWLPPENDDCFFSTMLRKEVLKDNFSERNPKDNLGETPLHFAAQNGHLSVCQLIINNIKVSNNICCCSKMILWNAKVEKNSKVTLILLLRYLFIWSSFTGLIYLKLIQFLTIF